MSVIIIKSTYPDKEEAIKSINNLLDKNLISSANYFPIKSISKWSGEIKEVDEILVFFKTKESNWKSVRDEIQRTHSYEVPCILKIYTESNESYESWIEKQTS